MNNYSYLLANMVQHYRATVNTIEFDDMVIFVHHLTISRHSEKNLQI